MEGIKELLQIPIAICPFISRDGAGDAVYGDNIDTTCYAEETLKTVLNRTGKEVLSNITFYIDGADTIGYDDLMEYFGNKYPIKSLTAIRELTGEIALWEVNV